MTFIFAILLLCFLITIHEFGHYWVGRMCGIGIVEFAVGFGPKLIHWERKGIQYSIRLFPLGGYCQFVDEDAEATSAKSMRSAPAWKRLLTVLAGPAMNIFFALVLCTGYMMVQGNVVPYVGSIEEYSVAKEDGLQEGDIIRKVNGKTVLAYFELSDLLADAGDTMTVQVERNGEYKDITLHKVTKDNEAKFQITFQGMEDPQGVSLWKGMRLSVRFAGWMVRSTFDVIGSLFTGDFVKGSVVGPVGTVGIIADGISQGWGNIVFMLILLSLNLGIFNLLPIPALDGGRLVFILYEMIVRKPIPPEKEGMVHMIGMVALLGLMLFLTLSDLHII